MCGSEELINSGEIYHIGLCSMSRLEHGYLEVVGMQIRRLQGLANDMALLKES